MGTETLSKGRLAGGLGILQLRKLRHLFKDDAAFVTFVAAVRDVAVPQNIVMVLDDDQFVCGVVSPQGTQEALRTRIVNRLLQSPEDLDTLRKRLADNQTMVSQEPMD
jgi:hypothetical protein